MMTGSSSDLGGAYHPGVAGDRSHPRKLFLRLGGFAIAGIGQRQVFPVVTSAGVYSNAWSCHGSWACATGALAHPPRAPSPANPRTQTTAASA